MIFKQPANIPESAVSYKALIEALGSVFINAEIDDQGDLAISEGLEYPIWLSINDDARIFYLYSFVLVEPEDDRDLIAIADRCNSELALAQFSSGKSKDRVSAYAYYFYDELLLLKQFVRFIRTFASSVADAQSIAGARQNGQRT